VPTAAHTRVLIIFGPASLCLTPAHIECLHFFMSVPEHRCGSQTYYLVSIISISSQYAYCLSVSGVIGGFAVPMTSVIEAQPMSPP